MALIELSHTVHHGLETYRGLPAVGNTGTYVDAPFHRFADVDAPGSSSAARRFAITR